MEIKIKHLRRFWRKTLRPLWHDYEWPVVGALALVAMGLGFWGFQLQALAENKSPYILDMLFNSFQLFILQTSVESPMPWQLNAARLLAPLAAGYTALQALGELFAEEFQSLSLRFVRNHIVICGLGRKGLILARGFLERGQKVVVIEQDEENDLIRQCRDLGGTVILGDCTEAWLLRKAGLSRASTIFALCGNDGVNAEIAVGAAQLVTERAGPPLNCILHIFDPQLYALLRERELDTGSSGRLRLEFFNTFELGARIMLDENPLAVSDDTNTGAPSSRMVIVGMGRLGESLLVNAARHWQSTRTDVDMKIHVTLIDRNAQQITEAILGRYPSLKKLCKLTPLEMDVHSASFQKADFLDNGDANEELRVFVCFDDDSLSLSTALTLVKHGRSQHPIIVVRMSQEAGLAVLLEGVDTGFSSFRHLRAFGLLDRTCNPDQVMRGTHEILAYAIHENYIRQQILAGDTPEKNTSMVPWESLPDHLKESNRQQADDIGSKLQAVHCNAAPLLDWDEPLFKFTPEELEHLARMEHERWMASKLKDGWRHGLKKDSEAKTHPCLVTFEELPTDEQDKDRNAVLQIPLLLSKVGFRIHRLTSQQHREPQLSTQ